ncbi:MAG: hypothetical protein H0V96_05370 [Acidimicrobiia bacterium]|nr:hypothetical protein [Acidimicrobiia bacterium]
MSFGGGEDHRHRGADRRRAVRSVIVSRRFVPWKTALVWAMTMLTFAGLATPASRDFSELDVPRLVVVVAAVGIVA